MLLEMPERERGFKKERIIRVLLNHTGKEITKYRVAKLAEVSEPWCREYTKRLEEKELIRGTEAFDPRGLYDEWRKVRIKPNQLSVSLQNPMNLLRRTNLEYVLTTYRAENLQQGLVFPSITDFYVDRDEVEDWIKIVESQGMLGGGNTRIRLTDPHVFYNSQEIRGMKIVSTPQLILDLLEEGGPCEEATNKLIEKFHGVQR